MISGRLLEPSTHRPRVGLESPSTDTSAGSPCGSPNLGVREMDSASREWDGLAVPRDTRAEHPLAGASGAPDMGIVEELSWDREERS